MTSGQAAQSGLYACDHPGCEKAYKRKDHLERHQQNHSPEALHVCSICNKSFARHDVLKRHIQRHAAKPPSSQSQSPQQGPMHYNAEGPPLKRVKSESAPIAVPIASTSALPDNGFPYPHANNPFDAYSSAGISPSLPMPHHGISPWYHNGASHMTAYSQDNAYGTNTTLAPLNLEQGVGVHMPDDLIGWLFASNGLRNSGQSVEWDSDLDLSAGWSIPSGANVAGQPPPIYSEPSPHRLQQQHFPHHFMGGTTSPQSAAQSYGLPQNNPSEEYREFVLTEEIRQDMLSIIMGLPGVNLDSHVLSLPLLQGYFELYFSRFAVIYEIIHRPTFHLRCGPILPYLLLVMICIGSSFADDQSGFLVAMQIHQRVRSRVIEITENTPRVDVPVIQTLLLANSFGRMFASLVHHDMAQIFHSVPLVMARFSGLFSAQSEQGNCEPALSSWLANIAKEERIRVAWFCFVSDINNATLFRHPQNINTNKMKIPLPCQSDVWNASSALSWHQAVQKSVAPESFRSVLSSIIDSQLLLNTLSDYAVLIVLHGVIGISSELSKHDSNDLHSIPAARRVEWKERIKSGLLAWQNYADVRRASCTAKQSALYCWVGTPVCQLGLILLYTDTKDLRIFAGARVVAGRMISNQDREEAKARLVLWARTREAEYATWASLNVLQRLFTDSGQWQFTFSVPSNGAWCAYIAVVTIVGYSFMHEGRRPVQAQAYASYDSIMNRMDVDAVQANKVASAYITRVLNCGNPTMLPTAPNKNDVGGIVAMGVHLLNKTNWGITAGPRNVLTNILKGV